MPEISSISPKDATPEKKRALMKDITDAVVKNFEVNPEAVVVQIVEAPKADKMKGGLLFTERTPSKPAEGLRQRTVIENPPLLTIRRNFPRPSAAELAAFADTPTGLPGRLHERTRRARLQDQAGQRGNEFLRRGDDLRGRAGRLPRPLRHARRALSPATSCW